VFAQKKTVSGNVSDNSGPLPGVVVLIKGTTQGTETDFDGNYSIEANKGQTIQFSYIGMKNSEQVIADAATINVVLKQDTEALDEVIVTASGIAKKTKSLGYNVQVIDAEAMTTKQNADLVNSITGTTSGINITSSAGDAGASTNIVIRGAASLTGNNQPLFVVNGLPIISGGGYSGTDGVNTSSRSIDINPEDIKTMTVLKGGAATALYGVRAANGAVIITTKSGKGLSGRKVDFHTSYGLDVVSQLPARQKRYSQGTGGAWASGNSASWGAKISELEYDGDESYKWDPNGSLVAKGTGNGVAAKYYDPFEFFQTGTTLNNRFSISNGNEKGNFYFSVSNFQQEGISPNNTYDRTTLRLNGSTKLSDKVTFGAEMAYTNSAAQQLQKGSNVSGIMLGLLRTATTFDNSAGYEFADGSQRNYRNGGGYDNPYWVANNIAYIEDTHRFTSNVNFKVDFTDWFNVTYNGGIDGYFSRFTNQFKIGSRSNTGGLYSEQMDYQGVFNSDLLLNFKHDFSEDFKARLILGNNMYSTITKQLYGDADGMEIPNYYQLNNSSTNTTSASLSEYRTAAFFADIEFEYKEMLYLGFTGRNDWSTTMPEQSNSAFYPSASLGFIFTELDALKNDVVTYGKLRFSGARTANIAGAYNTLNTYSAASTVDGWTDGIDFPYLEQSGFEKGLGLANSDLTHENMTSWEVGTELQFLNNRIGLDFTYFNNDNEDLLMNVPISEATGHTSAFLNAGSLNSQGIEVTFTATPIKTVDFQWDIISNFTKISNEVVSLADGVENIALPGGFTVPQVRAVKGLQYGTIFGYDWYRDDQGKLLINNDPSDDFRDGFPMPDNREMKALGEINPDWTGNITNTFKYKDVSLSFMIDVKSGGDLYNGTAYAMNYFGIHERTQYRDAAYTDAGTIDFANTPIENIKVYDGVYGSLNDAKEGVSSGQTNVTPVVLDQAWFQGYGSNFGGGPTSASMEDASWVRLRNVTLTYDLPKLFKNVKSAQIYFTGRNLWLSTPYSGIDPETSLSGSGNGQGMDYFNSPGTKSYTIGLKVSI
jgi:TonB-linked SusC/RagA family outer membrane protein